MVLAAPVLSSEAGDPSQNSAGPPARLYCPKAQGQVKAYSLEESLWCLPTHTSPRHQAPSVGRQMLILGKQRSQDTAPASAMSGLGRGGGAGGAAGGHRWAHTLQLGQGPHGPGNSGHLRAGREWRRGRGWGLVTADGALTTAQNGEACFKPPPERGQAGPGPQRPGTTLPLPLCNDLTDPQPPGALLNGWGNGATWCLFSRHFPRGEPPQDRNDISTSGPG